MSLEHTNRRGDVYFIFQGRTKTGKPKYYASKKPESEQGVGIDALPDEFEIFEHPENALVSIRRRKPSSVLPAERDFVHAAALELSAYSLVQTLIDGDSIVVYTPSTDPQAVSETFARLFGVLGSEFGGWTEQNARRTAELRFILVNPKKRLWRAERYRSLGFMEGWIGIGRAARLETLAAKFLPHLGEDSWAP